MHPVYQEGLMNLIDYTDEQGKLAQIQLSSLYHDEHVLPKHKCDTILTKIIYSYA